METWPYKCLYSIRSLKHVETLPHICLYSIRSLDHMETWHQASLAARKLGLVKLKEVLSELRRMDAKVQIYPFFLTFLLFSKKRILNYHHEGSGVLFLYVNVIRLDEELNHVTNNSPDSPSGSAGSRSRPWKRYTLNWYLWASIW